MTFTYSITCTLDATAAFPPVAGSEEQRAYWVTPTLLAWPLSLLPRGMDREVVVTDAGDPSPTPASLYVLSRPPTAAQRPSTAASWARTACPLQRPHRCASSGTCPTRSSPPTPIWRATSL